MESWQKLLLAAGGAAGVAALLYYLLNGEGEENEAETEGSISHSKEMSKQELLVILKELVTTQREAMENMSSISKKMVEDTDGSATDFDKVYQMVQVPEDPLRSRGLGMEDLEPLIQRHEADMEVRSALQQVMTGGAEAGGVDVAKIKSINVDKLVEINKHQVEELEAFAKDFSTTKDKSKYDVHRLLLAINAMLNCKVMQKFGLEEKDIQAATMAHQVELQKSMAFRNSLEKQQSLMESIMVSFMPQMGQMPRP
jgi:hypothetical protein